MTHRLWTPWRMQYILSDKSGDCVLCKAAQSDDEAGHYVLLRGEHNFVVMNIYPYNSGHLMVVPYEHVAGLEHLDDETLAEAMRLVRECTTLLGRVMHPDGFNVGINLGKAAGAGLHEHLHIHIVPRWVGDTNFISVLGETRVVPEMVSDSYERLRAALETKPSNAC
ncbi:MAG: HIT domain-containing protein [Chloroflexi bacterium]|nr:HIT domain-containing protein [Chloroflexota bacterium]MBU1749857.1 HIT domain-containing protein [Chloroflexota bacterium]MBU1879155.1 HIT domain-containing protein [Chloroflexota bacterium]